MLSLGKFEAPLLVMVVVILGGGGGGANGLQAGNFAGITINRHFRGDIFHNEGERRQFKRQEMLLFKFLHQLVRYAISRFMHFNQLGTDFKKFETLFAVNQTGIRKGLAAN